MNATKLTRRWVGGGLILLCSLLGCSDSRSPSAEAVEPGEPGSGSDGPGDGNADGAGSAGAASDDNDDDGDDGSGSSGDDSAGGGSSAGNSTAPGAQPTFAPRFPGAGESGADEPLRNGELCDYEPLSGDVPTADQVTTCFFARGSNDPVPAATLEQVLECVDGTDVVHLRLTFHPAFVDNTYGTGSIGWPRVRGHWFFDLLVSDHAELLIKDRDDEVVLQFKLDYLSEDPMATSGYSSLGVSGGEGAVLVGDGAWVIDHRTSLERNLNERGYSQYTVDSPHTDESFSPNPDTPNWDYRMVYEAWIDVAALGGNGFGGAFIEYVHASPSKTDDETIEVVPGECPPDFCSDPDGCYSEPPDDCGDAPDEDCGRPPPPDEECGDAPDEECGDNRPPDEEPPPDSDDPTFCEMFPSDPSCRPE